MKCHECGAECERGMRLTLKLYATTRDWVEYFSVTRGIGGTLKLPRSLDEPAQELTVFVEGV